MSIDNFARQIALEALNKGGGDVPADVYSKLSNLDTRVSILENRQKDLSYAEIADIVRKGQAQRYFNIGDQIVTTYTSTNNIQSEMPWDIVDFRDVELENGDVVPGMIIQSHYLTAEEIQFDAPETTRPAEQDCNGQIAQYGWNRWAKSAYRQWLNSNAQKNGWWTAQNDYDAPPAQLSNTNGFMCGLPADFIAMTKPVKIETVRNYQDPDTAKNASVYEYDVTYDRFFLPSKEEEYTVANEPNHREGKAWQYWIERLTPEATEKGEALPQQNYASADVTHALSSHIKYKIGDHITGAVCRLRSCIRSNSYFAWYVHSTGNVGYYYANYAYRSAPACVIC